MSILGINGSTGLQSADKEFDENGVVPTFKQSALRVMIRACIMEGSKGPMVIYPGGRGGGNDCRQVSGSSSDRHVCVSCISKYFTTLTSPSKTQIRRHNRASYQG
jgi:hypothetical protein